MPVDPTTSTDAATALRKNLRQQRRALSPEQQTAAALSLDRHLTAMGLLYRHRDIAFYVASDGEIDPHRFLQRALAMGVRCYLPVLHANTTLRFVRYRQGEVLIPNRFGIPEPQAAGDYCPPWLLGAVLLPLVGFDRQGSRLGMGAGYYDRTFEFSRRQPGLRCPRLLGLAHSCQEVAALQVNSWDIPVSGIVTEKEVIKAR